MALRRPSEACFDRRVLSFSARGGKKEELASYKSSMSTANMDKKRKAEGGTSVTLDNNVAFNDEKCYEFDCDDPVNMAHVLMRYTKAPMNEPPSDNAKDGKRLIVELKQQIGHLYSLKLALTQFVELTVQKLQKQKEQEISALFDSSSRFLSLGHNNLNKVLDFLDAESLYNAELASYTLNEIIFDNGHWKQLGHLDHMGHPIDPSARLDIPDKFLSRPPRFSFLQEYDITPEEEKEPAVSGMVRYMGDIVNKARRWEVLGEQNYNYHPNFDMSCGVLTHAKECRRNPDTKGAIESACWEDNGRCLNGACWEVDEYNEYLIRSRCFLRLAICDNPLEDNNNSLLKRHKVVWQGFCEWRQPNYLRDHDRYTYYYGGETGEISINLIDKLPFMDWPDLHEFHDWVSSTHRKQYKTNHVKDQLKVLLDKLRITVLTQTNDNDDDEMGITFGGYYRAEGDVPVGCISGFLHPRYFGDGSEYPLDMTCSSPILRFSRNELVLHIKRLPYRKLTSPPPPASPRPESESDSDCSFLGGYRR